MVAVHLGNMILNRRYVTAAQFDTVTPWSCLPPTHAILIGLVNTTSVKAENTIDPPCVYLYRDFYIHKYYTEENIFVQPL